VDAVLESAGEGASVESGRGRFNYVNSTTVSVGGDRVATVLHGGSNGHPNVEASGERAPALAELLRARGPHRVTRCDVAVDLYGEGVFQGVELIAHGIAADHGLKLRKIASPIDRSAGETVYIGSRDSSVFGRIYEKGKADAAAYGGASPATLNLWVRVELEVKPAKEMKALAASMAPEAFWGVSTWTARLAAEALAMAPDPIPFHPRRTATDDRAFAFMCAQYRNLLRRRCDDRHGGDRQALAAEILASIYSDQEAQAA